MDKHNVSTKPEIGAAKKSEMNNAKIAATPDVDGEMGADGDKRTKLTDVRTEEKQDITRDKNVTNNVFSKHCSDNKSPEDVEVTEESHTAKAQQVIIYQREPQSEKEDGKKKVNTKQTSNFNLCH